MLDLHTPAIPAFGAYMLTDDGVGVAHQIAQQGGWGKGNVYRGGLMGAARLSQNQPLATRLLAEIGNEPMDQARDSIASLTGTGTRLIVVGRADDLGTYRAIRAAGATDYFAFPVQIPDVLTGFDNFPIARVAQPQKARMIGVVGCSGGVGASALVQNLAYMASQRADRPRIALLDADLSFAPLAHDLNTDPTSGLRDALTRPERVDRIFLDASMAQLQNQLWLYSCALTSAAEAARLQDHLPKLLTHMADHFDAVFVDLARDSLLMHPEIAATLDHLVIVTAPGYAGINSYTRLTRAAVDSNPQLTITPVLSNLRPDTRLPAKEMAIALGTKHLIALPNEGKGMVRAQQAGQPYAAITGKGPYLKQVRHILRDLLPDQPRHNGGVLPLFLRRLIQ
jgi:pilus assembly protein CpaE